ncbi:MAG: hypothetical protein R3Y09_08490 [Clostridia bacterium]
MSKKVMDKKNRWRSKTVSFRVSPEEWDEIERLVRISGMTKQEYIMHRLQNTEMAINASPRVVKALREELLELKNMLTNTNIDENVIDNIKNIIFSIR